MQIEKLSVSSPLRRIIAEEKDWAGQKKEVLLWMTQQAILIRRFEEKILELKGQGLINGPVHSSIGQEAIAAGMGCVLRTADNVFGTHRAHHEYLAKALSAVRPATYNPLRDGITPDMQEEARILMSEIMGLADGCSMGRGGSMHLIRRKAGIMGTNAIVGGGVSHATGSAWADKQQGRDVVTVCFLGDGALYQGVTDEASNLAALWQAPVIFFIENNQYAVGTSRKEACSAKGLHEKAASYGMPGILIDGMDPMAVKLALEEIIKHRKDGWLPCYVNAETYRYPHHAGDMPGSTYGYREKDEEEAWKERDVIALCVRQLKRFGILNEKEEKILRKNAEDCVQAAADMCTEEKEGKLRVREELWPKASTITVGLRDDHLLGKGTFVESENLACDREIKYSDAIAAVTGRWMEKEPFVFLLGEEVANMGGGAYGATKGLLKKYAGRIRNTPISESGFSGLACGAAMNGMHPIVEIMFSSFALVAADQLFNQIGQLTHIYGGHVEMPLVVRTRVAIGLGYGAQHSMDPAGLYCLFPGWRVFAPTTPFDYIGLFNAAMNSRSPTLLIEHQEFYGRTGMIPKENLDYVVQPGLAKVRRQGKDVTVLAHSWTTHQSLEAARLLAEEGIEAEVIDLRTLDHAGLDYETIGRSIMKTGMLVTVEQSPFSLAIGPRIAAECMKRRLDYFDGCPVNVTGPDVPVPVSRRMEEICTPTVSQIADGIRSAALRKV